MASFVGTKQEFNRYIGSMLRNLVQQLTKKYKIEIGQCEHCKATENLEAAHVHSKDRGALINKILNSYTSNNVVTIDLSSFEQQFRDEHNEMKETILVLCKSCHYKYDSQLSNIPNTEEPNIIKSTANLSTDKQEISQNFKRLFSNQEIQYEISSVAQQMTLSELEELCELQISKNLFQINYPVFIKVSKNSTTAQKKAAVKDAKGWNRWTWKYEFERNECLYAITTQWYEDNDIYVKEWLSKNNANNLINPTE